MHTNWCTLSYEPERETNMWNTDTSPPFCIFCRYAYKLMGLAPPPHTHTHVYKGNGKGTVHPRKCHEGPEGEKRCSFILSLTSVLDGVGGQRHTPATGRLGRPHSQSWRVQKISPPTGFRSLARRELLYRLSYSGLYIYVQWAEYHISTYVKSKHQGTELSCKSVAVSHIMVIWLSGG